MSGQHGVRAVRAFRTNPQMRARVAAALVEAYDGTDYERETVDEVIDGALRVVAADTRYRAEDQARCNKVDECTATAVVLVALAEWLEAGMTS